MGSFQKLQATVFDKRDVAASKLELGLRGVIR